jgi:hypothetical protein
VTPAAASPTKEAEEWETIHFLATAIIRLRQVSQSAAAVPPPVTVGEMAFYPGKAERADWGRTRSATFFLARKIPAAPSSTKESAMPS